MPRYGFSCESKVHTDANGPRKFEQFINHGSNKRIDQYPCQCGAVAKRDFAADIQTIGTVGITPISPGDSRAHHGLAKELEFAFGAHKVNPDGSVDRNHAPFRDTGELHKYLNGGNDLGEPVLGDDGKPMRRKDGSFVRKGAKLFKYGKNASPSQTGVRTSRPRVPYAWCDESETTGSRGGVSRL